jgi:hypothetical protein
MLRKSQPLEIPVTMLHIVNPTWFSFRRLQAALAPRRSGHYSHLVGSTDSDRAVKLYHLPSCHLAEDTDHATYQSRLESVPVAGMTRGRAFQIPILLPYWLSILSES